MVTDQLTLAWKITLYYLEEPNIIISIHRTRRQSQERRIRRRIS